MLIYDLFSEELFNQMIEEKMLTVRPHEGKPLFIANYSDQAQYRNCWNEVTLNSRGLIYNERGEIVARPWRKFFNLGDAKAPFFRFDTPVEVTDKMDGSLGILYVHDGIPSIATRGSFHSTQAGWATKQIRRIHDYALDRLNLASARDDYTFLFEIIYPKNRIVVDYGTFEGLVLLGAVSIHTGDYLGPESAASILNWKWLTTEVMPYKTINDVLAAPDRENTEGYVIRGGNRIVKWKRPDYVELHRLISNLSEKSVWSGLEGGKSVEELIEGLPDEFHGFVRETSHKLLNEFSMRSLAIKSSYTNYRVAHPDARTNRRDFAWAIRDDRDKAYYFALLDGKPIDKMIWAELKPKGEDNRE